MMPWKGFRAALAASCVAAVMSGVSAEAGVMFSDGPGDVAPDEQVLVPVGQSAETIFGVTQDSGTTVLFSDPVGNETLATPKKGGGRIDSADGLFSSLRISLEEGLFFTEFEANPSFAASGLSFVVGVLDNLTGKMVYEMFTSQNGNNFFGVTATDGTLFSFIDIVGPADGITDVGQVRIGGITEGSSEAPSVPEPGTLALLGTGAIGLLAGCRRKRRRSTLVA